MQVKHLLQAISAAGGLLNLSQFALLSLAELLSGLGDLIRTSSL